MSLRMLLVISLCACGAISKAATPTEALFEAIRARDVAEIDRLLTVDPTLASARDAKGRSAVMTALFLPVGESIPSPEHNAPLQALLEHEPTLTFFESCAVGDLIGVQDALARDASIAKSWHPTGLSALHFAAFSGNVTTTQLLLDYGAELDARARNVFRNTPLQVALLAGNEAAARLLLDSGADPLVRQENGFAPIHEAAVMGRRDLVDLLLEKGADINSRGDDGRNALSEAQRGGYPDLVAYLRSRGAKEVAITADLSKSPQ